MKVIKKMLFLVMLLLFAFCVTACGSSAVERLESDVAESLNEGNSENTVKISLQFGESRLTATLLDNESSKDFIKLLPMTVAMKDLYASEKYVRLSTTLSDIGTTRQGYRVGDVSYWAPGNCLVIYYKQTGEVINGLQTMGRIDSGIEELEKYAGSITISLENEKLPKAI